MSMKGHFGKPFRQVCFTFAAMLIACCMNATLAEKPAKLLTKLPLSFASSGENTPVIFHGKPFLVENCGKTSERDAYLKIRDLCTGSVITEFGTGYYFVNAFVNGDVIHVFASQCIKDGYKDIHHFTSTDLKHWNKELAVPAEGDEQLFNCSVCRDNKGYLMAYESNRPIGFVFRFARSRDLSKWEKVPGVTFAGEKLEYSACPVVRYFAPYYYVIYLHAAIPGHNGWVSFLARSKDLTTWQLSPQNPILEASEGEGCNNSDVDLFEWEGNTYLFYATGDQKTWGNLRVAMYAGAMKDFYEASFPVGDKMIKVSAKRK